MVPRRRRISNRRLGPAFGVIFGFAACLSGAAAPQPPHADLVFRGGAVYTMDAARSWAEAVAVRDGTIVFVGAETAVEPFIGPRTRVVALDGAMVLPGFHDSHVHPVTGGIELGQCDLNGLATERELLDAVAACSETHPDDVWIVGGGWDLTVFAGGNPHRELLDQRVPGRAIFLSSSDAHSAWVSSRALELAGIDRSTNDPPPDGRIERDPTTGEPTGTLRETAMKLVEDLLPPLTYEEYIRAIERSLTMANGFGITSMIEARVTRPASEDTALEAFTELSRSGRLTARTRVSLLADPSRDETQVDDLLAKSRDVGGSFLRVDAVKIFADGVIEAHTAALLQPYIGLDHNGGLNFEPQALNRLVARIDRAGLQVHIHAIGDRAIRASLDALDYARARNGARDSRHHIAHIELFDPADIPRFRRLGVVANFQPLWAYADSYITDLTEPVLGPERSRWLYPIRSVVATGAVVVGGSDWSVTSMNPLEAIQVALTRRALDAESSDSWIPEERVDLPTALALYTINGAYLQHHEHSTGSLEVGKAADLVVLEKNLFEIAAEDIHEVRVLLTLLEGREVFRHASFRDDDGR